MTTTILLCYKVSFNYEEGGVVFCAELIKHYTMKAYGGVDAKIHVFLTSAVARGEWSAWLFHPRGKSLSYPLERRLGGSQNWFRQC
jgi:hypothetical protein